MNPSDLQTIVDEIRKNRTDQEGVHAQMRKDMDDIKEQLRPIVDIYSQFSGFGSVIGWVFKFLIIPASIVVGILLSLRQIKS